MKNKKKSTEKISLGLVQMTKTAWLYRKLAKEKSFRL
jgi:hypothetical protein